MSIGKKYRAVLVEHPNTDNDVCQCCVFRLTVCPRIDRTLACISHQCCYKHERYFKLEEVTL